MTTGLEEDGLHWCGNITCHNRIAMDEIECSSDCAALVTERDQFPKFKSPNHIMTGAFSYKLFDTTYDTQLYVPISTNLKNVLTRSFFSPKATDGDKHHRFRHNYLTASNVASALNMNPYSSVRHILEYYMNPYKPSTDNHFMKRGREMESVIASKFIESTGLSCVFNQGLTIHPDYPFLAATFDLLTIEGVPVEIKFMVSRNPSYSTIMPKMYWVQCQIQMQVAQSQYCYYVEYKQPNEIDPEHFSIITIQRDDQWFNNALPVLKEFWDVVCSYRSFFGASIF